MRNDERLRTIYEVMAPYIVRNEHNWRDYLAFASQFHKHSFDNILLVYAQDEDVSILATRKQWAAMEDGTLRPFSIRWPHSAIMSSTDFSIQSISAPLKIVSECSLSLADILEPDADPKYFLSPQAVAKLLSNS